MRSLIGIIFLFYGLGNHLFAIANFPTEPLIEVMANLTAAEDTLGRVAECRAIPSSDVGGLECGSRGIITQRGIVPVNMWPNQPLQTTAANCALFCQNRVGSQYRSFGVEETGRNVTVGYKCECFDTGVGALKLEARNKTATFYDSACFSLDC